MGPSKLLDLFWIAAANTFKLGYLLAVAPRIHAAPLGGLEGLGCGSGLCLVRRFRALGFRGLQRIEEGFEGCPAAVGVTSCRVRM